MTKINSLTKDECLSLIILLREVMNILINFREFQLNLIENNLTERNIDFYNYEYFRGTESWWNTTKENEKKLDDKEYLSRAFDINGEKVSFISHLITKLKNKIKDGDN